MSIKFGRRPLMMGLGAAAFSPFTADLAKAAAATPVTIANAPGAITVVVTEVMKQQKFLESFGLDPNVMSVADGSKILGGIVGGSINVSTMSGFAQIFPAIERGASLKVIGGADLSPTFALYTANPSVKTLKDLEGKTIGSGSIGALIYQITVALLKKYGVDVSKIRFVNVGSSSDVFRAVQAGTVDAGVGEASRISHAEGYKVRLVEHGDMTTELPEYTFQGAWTSDDMIKNNRDMLVRTMAAYAKLYRFLSDPNSKEAYLRAQHTVYKSGLDSSTEDAWNYLQRSKPFARDLVLSPERINYLQQLNIEFDIQKTLLPFDRVADMSIAREAIKLLDKS